MRDPQRRAKKTRTVAVLCYAALTLGLNWLTPDGCISHNAAIALGVVNFFGGAVIVSCVWLIWTDEV